jgi:hypothetical protein
MMSGWDLLDQVMQIYGGQERLILTVNHWEYSENKIGIKIVFFFYLKHFFFYLY